MRKWESVFTKCQLSGRHTRVLCRHCLVALEGEALSPGEEKGFGAVYMVSFMAGS